MTIVEFHDADTSAWRASIALLLDAGYLLNFAVIPEIALDDAGPDGQGRRFIDQSVPDTSAHPTAITDSELERWLKNKIFFSIRHFSAWIYAPKEAPMARSWQKSRRRSCSAMQKGRAILEKALGNALQNSFRHGTSCPAVSASEQKLLPFGSCGWASRDDYRFRRGRLIS